MDCFKIISIFLLIFCFSVQVWDGFLKFIKRQTTVVSTTKTLSSQILPAFSFCPGFKDESLRSFDGIERPYDLPYNRAEMTESDYMSWWKEVTYDPGEILTMIKPPQKDKAWIDTKDTIVNSTGYFSDIMTTISEVGTVSGRCYAVYIDWPMEEGDFFSLRFNFADLEELTIYVHERHDEIGLNMNSWPVYPESMTVKGGVEMTAIIQENYLKSLNKNEVVKCDDDDEHSYPRCVLDWSRSYFRTMHEEAGRKVCWYPGNSYIANPTSDNMEICLNAKDESFSKTSSLLGIIERLHNQKLTDCPKRCKETSYQIKTLKLPMSFTNKNETFLYLMSEMQSQYNEEVLMYDFNNIVSAMGGSLGLFLGISFYSVVGILAPKFGRSVGSQTHDRKEAP